MTGQVDRLNLGCALNTPKDWINLDGSWNARLAKYPPLRRWLKAVHILPAGVLDVPWPSDILVHNVKKPFPFPEKSLRAVYASHLLEHLYLDEGKRLLLECFRVLQPGGILRIVGPDAAKKLEAARRANSNLKSLPDPNAPPRNLLLRIFWSLRTNDSSGNSFRRLCNSIQNFRTHKHLYDAKALIFYFGEAGFVDIQEMGLHESRIEGIGGVELAEHVSGGSVCVEGRRPDS